MPWVRASQLLGLLFISVGLGVMGGHWMYDHTWHLWPNAIGIGCMLFGALLIDPAEVKNALGTAVSAVRGVWRGVPPSDGGG